MCGIPRKLLKSKLSAAFYELVSGISKSRWLDLTEGSASKLFINRNSRLKSNQLLDNTGKEMLNISDSHLLNDYYLRKEQRFTEG